MEQERFEFLQDEAGETIKQPLAKGKKKKKSDKAEKEGALTIFMPEEPNLGLRLGFERERRGLHLVDVADHLRVPPSVIEAIEQNLWAPEDLDVFKRGYVRIYARYLGISIDDVNRYFKELGVLSNDHDVKPLQFKSRQVTSKDKTMRFVSFLIVVALVGLVLVWLYLR